MADDPKAVRWTDNRTPGAPRKPRRRTNEATAAILSTLSPADTSVPADPAAAADVIDPSVFYQKVSFGTIRTPTAFGHRSPKKRKHVDENTPPFGFDSPTLASTPASKRAKICQCTCSGCVFSPDRQRAPRRTDAQKLDLILAAIKDQNWTIGCFLYNTFRTKDLHGNDVKRSPVHSQTVSAFLDGRGKRTVASIIEQWMKDPYGRIPDNSASRNLMFSTTVPYTDIGPVRAALTTFSTAIIAKKVAQEAENAVKLTSGLHVSVGRRNPESRIHWTQFGANTIPRVESIIEKEQRVSVHLFEKIAMRKPRTRNGEVLGRKTRPVKGVITHAISALNFCRTDQANLLPLTTGILYFGSSAPVELMNYNARIGNMPAVSTVRRALVGLSDQEAIDTAAHGKDPTTAGFMFVDNTQNMTTQRDKRIGRESVMNVGMSGLWMEAPDIDVDVFDLAVKREWIQKNLRKLVTVDQLLNFLDAGDADFTGALMFMEALTRCVPEMKPQNSEVHARLRATATHVVPAGQTVVHPLASSGKKQTIPTELKDVMLDFLQQVGQTPEDYLKRKLPVGGNGLTYAMLQQLQVYLQFHNDPFQSFEILEPQLQLWHTKWTDLIRIYQTHWGRVSGRSTNPSSLGFSASKIGRAPPSDMKKVEFYPGAQLLYLVLDARLLDIWSLAFKTEDIFEYFKGLKAADKLPVFDDLFITAQKLYRAYGTARGRDRAMFDTSTSSEWAKTVPTGSVWVPAEIEKSSLDKNPRKSRKPAKATTRKKKEKPDPKPCQGDHVLGQSIDFIRDALNSRKLATAVASGDLSRIYECLKYILFTFAGSTHTNYISYVLETVINLELEGLKLALLRGLVWSLTGNVGQCEEGDFIVEFFNRLLEDIVEHKSAQFDDKFIRDVISRNLRNIALLKLAWRTGVGMEKKTHKHSDPHTKPEMRILLKVYRETELHQRRLGRQIDDRDTDDFARGVKKLREGALEAFKAKTLFNRQVVRTDETPAETAAEAVETHTEDTHSGSESEESEKSSLSSSNSSDSSDSDDEVDEPGPQFHATRGSTSFIDGELVFNERDMMAGPSLDDDEAEDSDANARDSDEEYGGGDSDEAAD
ncbi:hypothetical protein DFH07DRAFT_938258 [Mycena maculata]|uniref:DUF6589 domain-containing protein n=1 Tax=Mycena maculata TaxID=230809 RepID=A0AAD7JPA3_9AGAR|nr:hypothetical protein DFH07DRAFT_938258 [Mycena maculata]